MSVPVEPGSTGMTSQAHAAAAPEAGVRCASTAGSTTASTAAVDPKTLFVIFIGASDRRMRIPNMTGLDEDAPSFCFVRTEGQVAPFGHRSIRNRPTSE